MASTIVRLDRAELESRRAQLLADGMTEAELEDGADRYTLTNDEWETLEELREIAFLLADR